MPQKFQEDLWNAITSNHRTRHWWRLKEWIKAKFGLRNTGYSWSPVLRRNERTDLLFVTSKMHFDWLKDVIAVKKTRNWRCSALVSDHGKDPIWRDYLDDIWYYSDYSDLVRQLGSISARFIIARQGSPKESLLTHLYGNGKVLFKPMTMVYRYQEGTSWNDQDTFAEKFSLTHTDGILNIYGGSASRFLKGRFDLECPTLTLQPYCIEDFFVSQNVTKLSSFDQEIHIGHAAGLFRRNQVAETHGYGDQIKRFRVIVDQGVHVHLHVALSTFKDRWLLSDYHDLAKESKYFHFEPTLPYLQLLTRLSEYDFGLSYFPDDYLRREFSSAVGNNYFTFLEAGIPPIASPSSEAGRLNMRYGFGVNVAEEALSTLRKRLESIDMEGMKSKVINARKNLVYDGERLAQFIEKA